MAEISGSLGDVGTLIPLLVGTAKKGSVQLAPALFFAGVANVFTGVFWDVPMCVQPMKSIAAVAISEGLSAASVSAAGVLVGALIFLLGLTNLIEVVNLIVPQNVVSGLQIGVGLKLAIAGVQNVLPLPWAGTLDCKTLAVVVSLLGMWWLREPRGVGERVAAPAEPVFGDNGEKQPAWRRVLCCFDPKKEHPVGIYLFGIGMVCAVIALATSDDPDADGLPLRFFGAPVALWAFENATGHDWSEGVLEGALPQLPLTTLNSVISVCCLAHTLYPEKRRPAAEGADPKAATDGVVSRREVSVSVGVMNMVLCPFGAMPCCHGAGGLAGQHRMGARHGASVVFLGVCKIVLAVFFGASAMTLLDALPDAVLGVMLAITGQELATTGVTMLLRRPDVPAAVLRIDTVVAMVAALVILAAKKTHYGALSGWAVHMIYGTGIDDAVAWYRGRTKARQNSGQALLSDPESAGPEVAC
eukprot:TRINITY_DN1447_c0_g3_i1.p2 TRINITY_DN1447_c0_g3~~TRINITY_DN1447_c0_g3_i1.p2  ORF type:complete len:519 (+),score=192.30 TRINITY_DN1447_c0_g3_i1:144-1559(+)